MDVCKCAWVVCMCVCVCGWCVCRSVYGCVYIQGDSGGIGTTLGNDSMSDSKQKIHKNMGPILNGYGVSIRPHVNGAYRPAGGWWLTVCIASITFAS